MSMKWGQCWRVSYNEPLPWQEREAILLITLCYKNRGVGQFHLQISLNLQRTISYLWVDISKCLFKFSVNTFIILEVQEYFIHILWRKQKSLLLVLQNLKKRPRWHLCTLIPVQGLPLLVISFSREWDREHKPEWKVDLLVACSYWKFGLDQ